MIIIPKRLGLAKMFYIPANVDKRSQNVTMNLTNTETKEARTYSFSDQRPNNSRYYGLYVYTSGMGLEAGTYEYSITGVNGVDRGLLRIYDAEVNNTSYYDTETYKYYKD